LAQLRGIFRASAFGRLKVMYPLISDVREVRAANALLEEAKRGLRAEGGDFDEGLPVGVMIETPSAALLADALAKKVDFFSLGTNDLTQYTLAVDRGNERVASLYEPFHPAVLRLIRGVIEEAGKAGIPVALCGEMAADPLQALILIGLGLRDLSMAPRSIPGVKQLLRSISLAQASELAEKALGFTTAAELRAWVREVLAPQFLDELPRDLASLSAPV
jgi:phosphotransferase system enzyme I (PtsI)